MTRPGPKPRSDLERFVSKFFADPTDCWMCESDQRYPGISINGKRVGMHIAAYLLFVGPIPEGYDVHHTCENKRCANPRHLVLLPHGEHRAQHAAEVDHCPRGHAYTPENTYERSDGRRGRNCRACQRERRMERSRRR